MKRIKEKGFVKYIIYFAILVLILSFFGFDIQKFMTSEIVQKNINYIMDNVIDFWSNYFKPFFDMYFLPIVQWINENIIQVFIKIMNNGDFTVLNPGNNLIPQIN